MQKLIRTRQGAILYAVAAPLLAFLFLLLGHASGFWRFPDAGLILLSLLMGFGVCALILLLRWVLERLGLLQLFLHASAAHWFIGFRLLACSHSFSHIFSPPLLKYLLRYLFLYLGFYVEQLLQGPSHSFGLR